MMTQTCDFNLERPYIPIYYSNMYPTYSGFIVGGQPGSFGGAPGMGGFSQSMASSASSSSFGGSSYFGGLSLNSQPSPVYYSSPERVSNSASVLPPPAPRVVEIRKTFPETWMFDSFEFNST